MLRKSQKGMVLAFGCWHLLCPLLSSRDPGQACSPPYSIPVALEHRLSILCAGSFPQDVYSLRLLPYSHLRRLANPPPENFGSGS